MAMAPLVISLPIKTPVVAQVLPVDGVGFYLDQAATQGTNQGAVILNSESPAIKQDMAIGTQT